MNLETAKTHIRNGWIAGLISGGITLIVVLISLTGVDVLGFNIFNLVDVAVIFGLTYGIYKESRICAVLMFVYFLLSKISIWIDTGKPSGIFTALIFFYFYLQAIRGTFVVNKLINNEVKSSDSENAL